MRVGAERDDAASALREQVFGRRAGAVDVGHRHVVAVAVEQLLTEDHHGALREECTVVAVEAERAVEDAVDQLHARPTEDLELDVATAGDLLDEHGEPARTSLTHDRVGELREVGVAEVGDDEADHAGPAGAETPGREVGAVAEFGDRALDLGAGRVAHVRVVVDDVRDGFDRDARSCGDVVHRDRHASPPPAGSRLSADYRSAGTGGGPPARCADASAGLWREREPPEGRTHAVDPRSRRSRRSGVSAPRWRQDGTRTTSVGGPASRDGRPRDQPSASGTRFFGSVDIRCSNGTAMMSATPAPSSSPPIVSLTQWAPR